MTQYFWPESFVINNLVKTLVMQGHTVEVFTGKPNYPDGAVFPGYIAHGCINESFESTIPVHRVPLRPRGSGGAKNLFLNYLSFVFNGLWYFPRMFKGHSFDVIFVFTLSPITSVIPAIYLKWKLKKHLAIWVLDLWPDSLSATGFIRNKFILWMVGCLVRGIYACADTILVQSYAFITSVSRYANPDKLVYYPSSHLDVGIQPLENTSVPTELLAMLSSCFCLVFAGNLGTAQAVETLVGAAMRLSHLPDFKLVLVGSGSMSNWLEQQKAEHGLENLVLAGRFPPEDMPQFFQRAKGLLVSLRRAEIFAQTVPGKVQSYLAAGRPIIASLDGEGARIVDESGAGLSCPAEDIEKLVACIERLYNLSPVERESMGHAGRAYFLEHFEMTKQSQRLIEILEARISQ